MYISATCARGRESRSKQLADSTISAEENNSHTFYLFTSTTISVFGAGAPLTGNEYIYYTLAMSFGLGS